MFSPPSNAEEELDELDKELEEREKEVEELKKANAKLTEETQPKAPARIPRSSSVKSAIGDDNLFSKTMLDETMEANKMLRDELERERSDCLCSVVAYSRQ